MSETRKSKLPTAAQIGAWLALIATLIAIITGIVALIDKFSPQKAGLSDDAVAATLGAMQSDKDRAELQLTNFALQGQEAANQGTLNAIAGLQATLTAVGGQQNDFVGTQNAISGLTATADAAGTQNALNAGLTQAAIANVTPTPTTLPTATPSPVPVSDYRSLQESSIKLPNKTRMSFSLTVASAIPDSPPPGLTYVWFLDTDINSATGQAVQDIGADTRISVRFDNGGWVGTVRSLQPDGTEGQVFLFLDIRVNGDTLDANLDPTDFNLPTSFYWVVRAESNQEVYPFLPDNGHLAFAP